MTARIDGCDSWRPGLFELPTTWPKVLGPCPTGPPPQGPAPVGREGFSEIKKEVLQFISIRIKNTYNPKMT